MLQGTIGNAQYGVVSISFPIPGDEYEHVLGLLRAMGSGDAIERDCHMFTIDSGYPVLKRLEGTLVNLDELDYLARRLDSFVPGVKDPEEYGKYMIQESGHFEYDPNLDNFYNYSQYGWSRINRELGQFSELGYISYQGTMTMEELLCGDPVERMDQQTDGIGGMA